MPQASCLGLALSNARRGPVSSGTIIEVARWHWWGPGRPLRERVAIFEACDREKAGLCGQREHLGQRPCGANMFEKQEGGQAAGLEGGKEKVESSEVERRPGPKS